MASEAIYRPVVFAEYQARLGIHAHRPDIRSICLRNDERPGKAYRPILLQFKTSGDGDFSFGNCAALKHEVALVDFLAQRRRRETRETEIGKSHLDGCGRADGRQRGIYFCCQVRHKTVRKVRHAAIGLDVQAKQAVEHRDAEVLLLHPHVRDARVFGQILVGDAHIGHIGGFEAEFGRIFL